MITYPYISRILGSTNLGKYSFSDSIIQYFMILATLGVTAYAVREGATISDDHRQRILPIIRGSAGVMWVCWGAKRIFNGLLLEASVAIAAFVTVYFLIRILLKNDCLTMIL